MEAGGDLTDALAAAVAEIRQLRATIAVMRESIEEAHLTEHRKIREAVTASNDEALQLRQTVIAMREQIEELRAAEQVDLLVADGDELRTTGLTLTRGQQEDD
jgi:alkylated DNA nucleotide flippase Atl1